MILTDARARTHTRMSTCFRNVAAQGDFGGWVISTYNIHIIVFLFFFFFFLRREKHLSPFCKLDIFFRRKKL